MPSFEVPGSQVDRPDGAHQQQHLAPMVLTRPPASLRLSGRPYARDRVHHHAHIDHGGATRSAIGTGLSAPRRRLWPRTMCGSRSPRLRRALSTRAATWSLRLLANMDAFSAASVFPPAPGPAKDGPSVGPHPADPGAAARSRCLLRLPGSPTVAPAERPQTRSCRHPAMWRGVSSRASRSCSRSVAL